MTVKNTKKLNLHGIKKLNEEIIIFYLNLTNKSAIKIFLKLEKIFFVA